MKGKVISFFNSTKKKTTFKSNKKIIWIIVSIIAVVIIWAIIAKLVNPKVKLSCEEAEKAVIEKIGGGKVTSCTLEHKRYEIEIIYNNYIYEFEVNGNTGEIIEYEGEYGNKIPD